MTAAAQRKPLQYKTLVLNADFRPMATYPLSIISAQDAVSAIWRDRVNVVETWQDAYFRSPSTTIAVPKVIALRTFAPIGSDPKFCRRSVILRDRFRCQYCGGQFPSEELTYDHVVPRARGGRTEWSNIVMACIPCNAMKDDRSDMKPQKMPRRPTNAELLRAGLEFLPTDIYEDFGDFLYWSVSLKA